VSGVATLRRSIPNLLFAVPLIYFILLGGTDAGLLVTPLRAIGAAISAVVVAWCIVRRLDVSDITDRLVVLALLTFLATCMVSSQPRLSLDAAISALALCSAFLIARGLLADERARVLLITVLGLCGLVIGVVFAALWGAVWIRWLSIPGAGIPPLDLILPVGPYRHFHLLGTMVAMLLPALFVLWGRGGSIRLLAFVGVASGAAVILMSGSRTAWLAAVLGLGIPLVLRHREAWRRIPLAAPAAVIVVFAVAVATGLAEPILSRLLGTDTIALRADIWAVTLQRWLLSPLVGSGPGTFIATLTLGGYYNHFAESGRHAHNAVIQLLAEGGLVGVASLGLLGASLVAGVRNWKALPWAPTAGTLIFALNSLTDNPADMTALVVIALAWAALLVPRVDRSYSIAEPGRHSDAVRGVSVGAGFGVALATIVMLLASWAFDQAGIAAQQGHGAVAVQRLSVAIALDPSFALYRRDRGVWRIAQGDTAGGRRDLENAFALNPADATAAREVGLLASEQGADATAEAWAERAVRLRATHAENGLTLAYVAARAGDGQLEAETLSEVLRREPWVAAAPGWSTWFPVGDALDQLLARAQKSAASEPANGRLQLADAWLAASIGLPSPNATAPDGVASAAVIDCRLTEARAAISGMTTAEAVSLDGLSARILVARASGSTSIDDLIALAGLRSSLLGILASQYVPGASPFADPATDVALYRRLPMPAPGLDPILPTADSGTSAWLRDPAGAADRGAPNSDLARCQ